MSAAKRYGLRLTLGGAPNTPHVVPGLPGYYRPDIPTPVGGDGELSLEAAREADKGSEEVELVAMTAKEASDAEAVAADTMKQARRNRAELRNAEAVRAVAERDAQKGA